MDPALVVVDQLGHERYALIGDAGHSMPPDLLESQSAAVESAYLLGCELAQSGWLSLLLLLLLLLLPSYIADSFPPFLFFLVLVLVLVLSTCWRRPVCGHCSLQLHTQAVIGRVAGSGQANPHLWAARRRQVCHVDAQESDGLELWQLGALQSHGPHLSQGSAPASDPAPGTALGPSHEGHRKRQPTAGQ